MKSKLSNLSWEPLVEHGITKQDKPSSAIMRDSRVSTNSANSSRIIGSDIESNTMTAAGCLLRLPGNSDNLAAFSSFSYGSCYFIFPEPKCNAP